MVTFNDRKHNILSNAHYFVKWHVDIKVFNVIRDIHTGNI